MFNLHYNLNNLFINPRGFFFNFLEKWVFTTNHKRVGINYMWYCVFAGVIATFLATVIKLELGESGSLYCAGNMRIYLSVVTGHAVVMVFLTYVPIYYGAFANYLIPIQLGARDFAYPRLNNFSFWVFPPSLIFFTLSLLRYQGLVTGWTFYPPLSSRKYSSHFNVDVTILSVVLIAIGSLISTSNLISTYRYMRGASMKADYRFIPLSVYGTLFGAVLFTLVAPVLAVSLVMLYLDRHGITNFFNISKGGDVILYQHIFWFFGHPEVYVLLLPAFGYVSNIVVFTAKHNILTYDHMVISMFAICILGMIVWGHHMYIGGLNRSMKNMFSATSLFVSIPSTLKIHSWTVTLQTGNLQFSISTLFLFTFLIGILIGGITGMIVGTAGFDVLYHDTYYVIGHFHLVLSMGGFAVVFGVFYHYWFVFFRVRYNKLFAIFHFIFFFFGELLTFIPAMFLGMSGMPRRINDYPIFFNGWHGLSSLGHGFVIISLFIFFFIIVESKFVGEPFLFSERNSVGVPYFANRFSSYIVLFLQLRQPIFYLNRRGLKNRGCSFLFKVTYSYKSIIFVSTSSIFLNGVFSLFLPTSILPLDNFFYFLLLTIENDIDYNYKFFWAWWGDRPTFKEDYLSIILNSVYSEPLLDGIFFLNDFVVSSYVSGNVFSFFFFLNFIKFFVLCLFIFIFIFYFKILNGIFNSLIRLYSFLKSTVTINLPFLTYSDSILIFFFFFSSVYLLEVHFFFIFFCQGSSDSLNYQFNFLLSSFFFIFFFKLFHNLYQQSVLFTFSSFNQSFLNFYSGSNLSIFKKKNKFYLFSNSFSKNSFFVISSFFFFFTINTFFFLSTFLVWFLRFCIQFVRLLVLFIVHTVFEFIIVSSDSYLSEVNSMNFFLFKSFFLFFFYFFGFLYLIVYLNLMFTLQVFIFYFFSEIFQSNFIFDLAAVSISNLKKF